MTDLNKEREAFEQHLIDTGLVEFAGYGFEVDECDEYTHEPTNVAWATWIIGLNRAKAQAVPDTHIMVPKDVAKRTIGHIGTAMCHPNNTRSEEDTMVDDQESICRAIKASESGAEG